MNAPDILAILKDLIQARICFWKGCFADLQMKSWSDSETKIQE